MKVELHQDDIKSVDQLTLLERPNIQCNHSDKSLIRDASAVYSSHQNSPQPAFLAQIVNSRRTAQKMKLLMCSLYVSIISFR